MDFPISKFICAYKEYNTPENYVPQPMFRRTFDVGAELVSASLIIGSLGYYEVHINGEDITKGEMAPYRSNPEHYVYFDRYEIGMMLQEGKNVIAVLLGNGFQNSVVETWDFVKLPWRSAPQLSFSIELKYLDGTVETVFSDSQTKGAKSPIIFNDFHCGEHYDARLERKGWDTVDFDDSDWTPCILMPQPSGEARLCEVEPIIIREELKPISVTECDGGYIYDFGENNAGLCRLTVKGESGQRIVLKHIEALVDGKPHSENIDFDGIIYRDFQTDIYICKGDGVEIHTPKFTYHGFRYVYVKGITPEQATEDLLTYLVMSSDIKQIGSFVCDNNIVNKIQEATVRSDISNFHYFPTDCPHREKNGWTADASLSAEQLLMNFTPENSYREWLLNIYKSMKPNGELPGIIPTATWGYEWGNGPAWDNVIVYLPYYTYVYRGDKKILTESAVPLENYLGYLYSQLDENDLIAIGLGDWCQPGKTGGGYDTPLIVTDSIVSVDIARKAEFIFGELGMQQQALYARTLAERMTTAVRKHLIKDGLVEGGTQTAQAMALYYGIIEEQDKQAAFSYLLKFIDEKQGHIYTGVLGARVLFRLLSDNGYSDLAFDMITREDFPSYGNWIKRGATTLWERFWDEDELPYSMNHHFWGDVSAWFYSYLGGIRFNPTGKDLQNVDIVPYFVSKLNHVKARHCTPDGEIMTEWTRKGNNVELKIILPEDVYGEIRLPSGYAFADGSSCVPLKAGIYVVNSKN